jgi:hypothetical protein
MPCVQFAAMHVTATALLLLLQNSYLCRPRFCVCPSTVRAWLTAGNAEAPAARHREERMRSCCLLQWFTVLPSAFRPYRMSITAHCSPDMDICLNVHTCPRSGQGEQPCGQ